MKILKRTGPKSVIGHLGLSDNDTFMYGKKQIKKKRKGKPSKWTGYMSTPTVFPSVSKGVRRSDTLPLRLLEETRSNNYRTYVPSWKSVDMREYSNFMSSRQPPPNFNRNLLNFTTNELNKSMKNQKERMREIRAAERRRAEQLAALARGIDPTPYDEEKGDEDEPGSPPPGPEPSPGPGSPFPSPRPPPGTPRPAPGPSTPMTPEESRQAKRLERLITNLTNISATKPLSPDQQDTLTTAQEQLAKLQRVDRRLEWNMNDNPKPQQPFPGGPIPPEQDVGGEGFGYR